jgi:tetratricopeptide (TPR) repeat protein
MHKPILTLVLLALTSFAASAADSPKDVQALIARGDYPAAETALRQAVSEHPESAKAHYILAEVLAHEGNIGEAKTEASKAATLDPATHFTDPAKFQAFQHKLDAALAPPSHTRAAAASARLSETQPAASREEGGGSHLTTFLIIGAVIVMIIFFLMRRRQNTNNQFGNGYPPAPPVNGGPSYGGQPYGGYQGGNPGYAPPPSSGVGTAVAAGLGGLAAGALLDEALRSHRDGEETRNVGANGFGNLGPDTSSQPDPSAQAYDDLRDDPIDMGNNDSSWDDSSSGGGDDDNQW